MSRGSVDLTPGAVLHIRDIRDFASRGHPAKNKYFLILGCITDSEVLGFLISSQLGYLKQESHKREVVRIPDRASIPVAGWRFPVSRGSGNQRYFARFRGRRATCRHRGARRQPSVQRSRISTGSQDVRGPAIHPQGGLRSRTPEILEIPGRTRSAMSNREDVIPASRPSCEELSPADRREGEQIPRT